MKNIVIFSQNRNFFGAQIVLIPFLMSLRTKYPGYQIVLFSRNPVTRVLSQVPGLIDNLFIETNKFTTFQHYRKYKPDLTFVFRKNSTFISIMTFLFKNGESVGFSTNINRMLFSRCVTDNRKVYRANNYLSFIGQELGQLAMTEDKNNDGGPICLIPGAGAKHKEWGINNYLDLARRLSSSGWQDKIHFILGEKETGLIEAIEKEGFSVLFDRNIDELIDLFKQARLVVANDCGPSHIAQIFTQKYIILYSNKNQDADQVIEEWFYSQKGCFSIVGEPGKSISSISVSKVYQLIRNNLEGC